MNMYDRSQRTLRVYPFHTGKWPPDPYPKIRLQGKWVRDAGFKAGDTITVQVTEGKLVITKGES